jgi:hypothetical protein
VGIFFEIYQNTLGNLKIAAYIKIFIAHLITKIQNIILCRRGVDMAKMTLLEDLIGNGGGNLFLCLPLRADHGHFSPQIDAPHGYAA